jgi:flagellar FliJ protein
MKKFKFRLEKILQYRDSLKQERLRELQLANEKLRTAEVRLEELKTEFENNHYSDGQILQVEEVYIRSAYSERLKQEISRQHTHIDECKADVEQARNIYIEASREAEVLVKLKDKKQEAFNEYVAKQEEIFLDELVTQRIGIQK